MDRQGMHANYFNTHTPKVTKKNKEHGQEARNEDNKRGATKTIGRREEGNTDKGVYDPDPAPQRAVGMPMP